MKDFIKKVDKSKSKIIDALAKEIKGKDMKGAVRLIMNQDIVSMAIDDVVGESDDLSSEIEGSVIDGIIVAAGNKAGLDGRKLLSSLGGGANEGY